MLTKNILSLGDKFLILSKLHKQARKRIKRYALVSSVVNLDNHTIFSISPAQSSRVTIIN